MKPMDVLKELNLVCWSTLFIGLQRGWATKSDIADYAIGLLSADLDKGDEKIAVLASADSLDDLEVKDLLSQISGEVESLESLETIEKWRLATLTALNESVVSKEEKLDKLQELYAEFDYPEDMISCSIYSQDSVDPLAAMSEVILDLKKKFRKKDQRSIGSE